MFKVYLNLREYFNVEFPNLVRYRWRDSEACDETNNDGIVDDKSFENTLMFQTMAAVCVATWDCRLYLQIPRLLHRETNTKIAG